MDIRKIKKLIDLVKETGVYELEIQEDKEKVRITCGQPAKISAVPSETVSATPKNELMHNNDSAKKTTLPEVAPTGHAIKSPMVGTVYLSSSPGTPPFVEKGRRVKVGEVVCLIEAMKMFNRIEADKDGVIKSRLVDNGQPVEFGQPLFMLEAE